MNSKFGAPIRYGIIGALIMVIVSFLSYLFYRNLFGSFWTQIGTGFFFLALYLTIPIWGSILFRRERGGIISFGDAFIGALIICALSSAGGSIMQYIIPNVIDTQYPEEITRFLQTTTSEYMEKMGAPDDRINETMKKFTVEKFKPDLLETSKSYAKALAFGIVISLIIAAFLKRNPLATVTPVTDIGTSA